MVSEDVRSCSTAEKRDGWCEEEESVVLLEVFVDAGDGVVEDSAAYLRGDGGTRTKAGESIEYESENK